MRSLQALSGLTVAVRRVCSRHPAHARLDDPRPWNQNPLLRLAAALRSAVLGNRGRINAPGDSEPPPIAPGPSGAHPPGRARRVLLTGLILSQTVLATYLMTAVLPYGGSSGLELLILVLYALLFSWISAGFWTAIMGFFVLLKGVIDTPSTPPTRSSTTLIRPPAPRCWCPSAMKTCAACSPGCVPPGTHWRRPARARISTCTSSVTAMTPTCAWPS